MAVRSIEEALKRLPRCTILLLCAGEIYCQAAGDMVRALTYYEIASKIEANENPLPYLNAARTYQQLAQFDHAWIHFKQAAEKDPELAMIKIDMAQALMQQGSTSRFDVFTQVNPFAQSADISNGASKRMVEVTALLDDALRCARQVCCKPFHGQNCTYWRVFCNDN